LNAARSPSLLDLHEEEAAIEVEAEVTLIAKVEEDVPTYMAWREGQRVTELQTLVKTLKIPLNFSAEVELWFTEEDRRLNVRNFSLDRSRFKIDPERAFSVKINHVE
jgi:hypothetical protein